MRRARSRNRSSGSIRWVWSARVLTWSTILVLGVVVAIQSATSAFAANNLCRQRVQQDTLAHRGRRGDPIASVGPLEARWEK